MIRRRIKTQERLNYEQARRDARERYPTTAERRAYLKGFRHGTCRHLGVEKHDEKNWPNAYSRGYWDGYAVQQETKS